MSLPGLVGILGGASAAAAGGGGGTIGADAGIVAAAFFTVSGGTVTLQDQKNVASVTRQAAGVYTINFTSALASANYGVIARARLPDSTTDFPALCQPRRNSTGGNNRYSTTAVDIQVAQPSSETATEAASVTVVVFAASSLSTSAYTAAAFFTLSGATVTLTDQKNVSSATRVTTGVHEIGFTSSLADADYSAFTGARYPDFTSDSIPVTGGERMTTSTVNKHTTAALDIGVGRLPGGSSYFDVLKASVLVRNADTAQSGTLAAVRFSVSGSTVTVKKSYNVASVTRQGTGLYRVNFTSALADANYGVICDGKFADSNSYDEPTVGANRNSSSSRNVYSTTAVDIVAAESSGSLFDVDTCDVWVIKPSLM